MIASRCRLRLRLAAAVVVAAFSLSACNDYRGDASTLQRNDQLTSALRGRAGEAAYTLPNEILSLNCFIANANVDMVCDVALDVRDPYVAGALKNPHALHISLENKEWIRRDGRVKPIFDQDDLSLLRQAKFNFVVERDAQLGGWLVRANVDTTRVPFEEAAALMLLAVVDITSEYTSTLKELYANSPAANRRTWTDIGSEPVGRKGRPMFGDAAAAAAEVAAAASSASLDSHPAATGSAGTSPAGRGGAHGVSRKEGAR